jgi:HSP20 family molecular chaperone IbpA
MSGRLSSFNSPFLLGFDQIEQTIDRLAKSAGDGYPPYNIEQLANGDLRITVAVAGFDMSELSIHLEGRQLVIRGKQEPSAQAERIFLHRGIAARQFQRSFLLAEDIEVTDAHLSHGLLHVDLTQPPPVDKVQRISIRDTKDADSATGKNGKGASGSMAVEKS